MERIKSSGLLLVSATTAVAMLCSPASAAPRPQEPPTHVHGQQEPKKELTLQEQIKDLRAKVAQLEAALQMNHQGQSKPAADPTQSHSSHTQQPASRPTTGGQMSGMQGMGMGGMQPTGGMGGMKGMGMMGGMQGMGMGGMQGMGGMEGMGMMGGMQGMQGMQGMGQTGSAMNMSMDRMKRMQMMGKMTQPVAVMSSLPGFPGASHIYHIGAAGHFLDHGDAVGLSQEQRKQLAVVHQESQLRQNDFERKIDQAEQELWVLTSAGEPDANAIAAKLREIATTQTQMRLAFIESVGAAANVLTEPQRRALVGEHQEGAHQDTKK